MWVIRSEEAHPGKHVRLVVDRYDQPASYSTVLRALRVDNSFRSLFNMALAECPYAAFRWETPPVSAHTLSRRFEFVLLNSPGLVRQPDRAAFGQHFRSAASDGVVVFPNLGGDAVLVVPCPLADDSAYGHLAAFVREAPEPQQHALWKAVATAMADRVSRRVVWLSTAGGGVSWLHVRLDDRPKYYGYAPYAEAARA
jgi:hypothetical protein